VLCFDLDDGCLDGLSTAVELEVLSIFEDVGDELVVMVMSPCCYIDVL
jgi:hypothetical protein